MILYTSDLHFGHKNVIRFDNRPFQDVEEMDRTLIELWNNRVQPDDTVYIIGDICFRASRTPAWYLSQLKGHKILILGNHDEVVLKDQQALRLLEGVENLVRIVDGENKISLCHFPIAEWHGWHRGTWHIYGHIHRRTDGAYRYMKTQAHALNAGCMINNYAPASFEELVRNNALFQEMNP